MIEASAAMELRAMKRNLLAGLLICAGACVGARLSFGGASALPQGKMTRPKIIFAKHAATPERAMGMGPAFGQTCKATGSTKKSYADVDRAVTVAEVMGAPVAVVKIRSYRAGAKKQDIQDRVLQVLDAATYDEPMQYDPLDEGVWTGIVATIQFADNKQGAFEESGGHVCVTDDSGAVWWMRVRVIGAAP
jgi:hypothetical protein